MKEQKKETQFSYKIGDVVRINHPKYGGRAIVYEIYKRNFDLTGGELGISLITEEGEDTGGWEPESWHFLELLHRTGMEYYYNDSFTLMRDFNAGFFTPYFEIL